MQKLLVVSLLLCGFVSLGHSNDPTYAYSNGQFQVPPTSDFLCKYFSFVTPFSSIPQIQLALHMKETSNTYEAAVGWVEQVATGGFTACVTASGPIKSAYRSVFLQWLAYTTVPDGLFNKEEISFWTAGSKCTDIDFISAPGGKVFATVPYVYVTPFHSSIRRKRDAMSVWVEDVTKSGFKVCMRELKSFSGIHTQVKVEWMAVEKAPTGWTIGAENGVAFQNTETLTSTEHYSFCKTVSFPKEFYSTPVMITTAQHSFDGQNPKSIPPKHNAITEWIEQVSKTQFTVCMKDIQPYDKHHDPVTVSYMAIGHLDPCLSVQCSLYSSCVAYAAQDARCECVKSCPDFENQQCGNDGVTYKNMCFYEKEVCETQNADLSIVHAGACYPFILHHGRVTLNLDTKEVECQLVVYKTQNFMAGRTVHVQVSVNYYNTPNVGFVHDATVAWAEKISNANFTACALKSGRNERITPDNGVTYVDYMAYQGAPAGAVAGEITLSNWWEGTTCKDVSLPQNQFNITPNAVVSSEHTVVGQEHDAATIWVENTSTTEFKVCLREMQNFDGLHQSIHVNWLAYDSLPSEMMAEKISLSFTNTYLPKVSDNFAYCKNGVLKGNYTKEPTMIATARHALGNLLPIYNSISVWIEEISTSAFRVCLKELHAPNGYDPVEVTLLAIAS